MKSLTTESVAFQSHQVDNFFVTVLNDGEMNVSLSFLTGIEETHAKKMQIDADVINTESININCYLIQSNDYTILIDSGIGGRNHSDGQLLNNLTKLGISPNDIDTILITHAHPDHVGGLLDSEEKPIFKNAQVFMNTLEVEYWLNDHAMEQATERGKQNFLLARKVLNAYKKRLNQFDNKEIIPGIFPILLPGHTPGHTGFQIGTGEDSVLIWGDIVHFPYIQLVDPTVSIAFDYNPDQAKVTRKNLLKQVANKHQLIAGMHTGKLGFAYIHAMDEDEKYGIEPLTYFV